MKGLAFALLLSLAGPAVADETFPFFYDRYAVMLSSEGVPQHSETTSFHRSQLAVLTRSQASAEAAARVPAKDDGRAAHRIADCACECVRGS
jgi:hypothetical protein